MLKQIWFLLLTKGCQKESFLANLYDFDQCNIFGNTVNDRQKNTIVNDGTADKEFTTGFSDNSLRTIENTVIVKTLERCFNERIDREMSNIVDTVENRIQNFDRFW